MPPYKPSGLITQFRVYPERPKYRYFTVRIFKSRRSMYKHFTNRPAVYVGNGALEDRNLLDFSALATTWTRETVNDKGETIATHEEDIGEILFFKSCTGAGYISHEMTHAALFWADRVGLSPERIVGGPRGGQDEHHEAVCRAVGEMTRQFCIRWIRVLKARKKKAN